MTIREKESISSSSAPLETAGTVADIPIAHATAVQVQQEFPYEAVGTKSNVAVATGAPIIRASSSTVVPSRDQQQQQQQRQRGGCCNSGHGWCCIVTSIAACVCVLCVLPILIFLIAAVTSLQNINEAADDDQYWNFDDAAYFDDLYLKSIDPDYPGK